MSLSTSGGTYARMASVACCIHSPGNHGDAQPARASAAAQCSPGAAENDHVAVAHVGSSVPACSATMYSAYQSGQFASASPMRFSCSP